MLTFNSAHLHSLVKARPEVGIEHHAQIDTLAFLEFTNIEDSVREDVAFLKNHPLILKETVITGFVYDVRLSRSVRFGNELTVRLVRSGQDWKGYQGRLVSCAICLWGL